MSSNTSFSADYINKYARDLTARAKLLDDNSDNIAYFNHRLNGSIEEIKDDLILNTIKTINRRCGLVTERKIVTIISRKTGIRPDDIKNALVRLHAEGHLFRYKLNGNGEGCDI